MGDPGKTLSKRRRETATQHILLIGCVGAKALSPAPARDLYISTLFRLRRAYADTLGLPWYVLSAKHGVVGPGEIIAPYDTRLSDLSGAHERSWRANVFAPLEAKLGPLAGRTFEFHAGKHYVEVLQPRLQAVGATVFSPLKGLRIGEQLHWYKERLVLQGGGP